MAVKSISVESPLNQVFSGLRYMFHFPLLYYNSLSSSTLGSVVMLTSLQDLYPLTVCLEGFLYGKISALCACVLLLVVAKKIIVGAMP